jgi:uncharacterized protein
MFRAVLVPEAVWDEVAIRGGTRSEACHLSEAVKAGWIRVEKAASLPDPLGALREQLDPGELEAILLAREERALLLTDDGKARAIAESLNLSVMGTGGLLVRAKREGFLPDVRVPLNFLRKNTNFRISDHIYNELLRSAGELSNQDKP